MPGSELKKLPGIFISYRRSDTPDAVGRIYDRLVSEFGKARVFKDVDSIPLGQDFRGHLNDIVGGCAAVLAIVGPKWTDTRNSAGQRRLEDPDDFVRIELEAALARNIPVVPVLVGHAPMPGSAELPTSLASMAFRQSIEVRPDPDFHNDATRLVTALRLILDPNAPGPKTQTAAPVAIRPIKWMVAFAVATLAAIALAIPALNHLRETLPPETRIAVPLAVAEGFATFALSPDGRQIAYVTKGDAESRLWLRSLSATTAQPLPGTGGARAPFWSPDGRSIAFFTDSSLKRLDLGSGQPQVLASAIRDSVGAWGAGGDILFNPDTVGGLVRVAATGGPVTEVTRLDAPNSGQRVLGFLPDGTHFIFGEVIDNEEGTYLGALDGSPPVRLTGDVGFGAYLSSGWLMMTRAEKATVRSGNPRGSLVAQRLDVRNGRLIGKPVTIAGNVDSVSVSASGLMAFRIPSSVRQRQLTWVDRTGAELDSIGDADETFNYPRIAPDGRRVLVSRVTQGNQDIWLLDGVRASRMTSDPSQDSWPVWSPDGQRIAFSSNRSGTFSLYEKPASGAGGEELLKTVDQGAYPSGWSADGRYLMYFAVTRGNDTDIRIQGMTGDRGPVEIPITPFVESWGQFSPDGRWVAYHSNESVRPEVFVRPLTSPRTDVQWMASTSGGIYPMWSANGKEIYYINPAGEMMATPVTMNGSMLVPGTPVTLFDARAVGGGILNRTGRQYDVAPDGRFLINREPDADAVPTVTLIQNWNPDADK